MSKETYDIPDNFQKQAHIDTATYQEMYQRSVEDPEGFWSKQAKQFLSWSKPWDRVLDWDFEKGYVRWFEGGRLNACFNCLNRHPHDAFLSPDGRYVVVSSYDDNINTAIGTARFNNRGQRLCTGREIFY